MSNIVLDDKWMERMKVALQHEPVMLFSGGLPDNFDNCSPIFCVIKERENMRRMITWGEDDAVTQKYRGLTGVRFLITDKQEIADALPKDKEITVILISEHTQAHDINNILLGKI